MYNLLIVDDEPIILRSLCEMVQEHREEQFTVFAASSAAEALEILEDDWIDLVMSDIRMPDMDGLQLLSHVEERWPHCRVIFLTGHSEFEYARRAVSPCVVAYVLKLDGDQKILAALDKAQAAVDAVFLEKSRRMAMESDLRAARPLICAECLRQMVGGVVPEETAALASRLKSADIGLALDSPMLVSIVVMQPGWNALQRARVQDALESFAREHYVIACSMILPDVLIGFFQAIHATSRPNHLLGVLEQVAAHLRHAGQGAPRIYLYGEAVALLRIPAVYSLLNHRRFAWDDAQGVQLCLPQASLETQESAAQGPLMGAFRVEALNNSLVHADQPAYARLSADLLQDLAEAPALSQVAAYTTLASLLLQAIANHLPREAGLLQTLPLERIGNYQAHASFAQALAFLEEMALRYFEARRQVSFDNRSYVIHTVNRYIMEHIGEGLSLTLLSDLVRLHPAYLSRIYKEGTGLSINQYIVNQRIHLAQSLLADPRIKISEIVTRTGLNTPSYFTYYFKKHVGMTPQEYRTHRLEGRRKV